MSNISIQHSRAIHGNCCSPIAMLILALSACSLAACGDSHGDATPVAQNTRARTRLEESVLIPLASKYAYGDTIEFEVVDPPSNGEVQNVDGDMLYIPAAGFSGTDQLTFRVLEGSDPDSASETATATIEVIDDLCSSSEAGDGSTDGLVMHVPVHITNKDLSPSRAPVTVVDTGDSSEWASRTDMTNRSLAIELGSSVSSPMTISFQMMPADANGTDAILRSDAITIGTNQGGIEAQVNTSSGDAVELVNTLSTLKPHTCNHVAFVLDGTTLQSYVNGSANMSSVDVPDMTPLAGELNIGPFPGQVWDVRIYDRALSTAEIETIGANCADGGGGPSPFEGYTDYLCGVYVCEYWPDNLDELTDSDNNPIVVTNENLIYYVHAQDISYELNTLEVGLFPRADLCGHFANKDEQRQLELTASILDNFVTPWSFDNPITWENGAFWVHENFHSFQSFEGASTNKFLRESTAEWGADYRNPGSQSDLIAFYTLHPHLPFWAIQDSPVEAFDFGTQIDGGHQYGAFIFFAFVTRLVDDPALIGDIFNVPGASGMDVVYDLLPLYGYELPEVFIDFASKTTTWDYGELEEYYRSAEENSLNKRIIREFGTEGNTNNKLVATYDGEGTGQEWLEVPDGYRPGSWAYNAFEVTVDSAREYEVGVNPAATNPSYAEFRARVVVHDTSTGTRTYHELPTPQAGEPSSIRVSADAGQKLYLVVATTPTTIFEGFEQYAYSYLIRPAN